MREAATSSEDPGYDSLCPLRVARVLGVGPQDGTFLGNESDDEREGDACHWDERGDVMMVDEHAREDDQDSGVDRVAHKSVRPRRHEPALCRGRADVETAHPECEP